MDTLNNATALFMLFMVLFFTGTFLISAFDQLPILDALFEAASAIGTVGLTLGITPTLSSASHCILIFLMFFGRIGGLTLLLAISKHQVVANTNFTTRKYHNWITGGTYEISINYWYGNVLDVTWHKNYMI